MKCISLWQPFASAIPFGLKRIETRHWTTNYRGELGIHAALKKDRELRNHAIAGGMNSDLPYGCIIAVVDLYNVAPTEVMTHCVDDTERHFGNYEPNRFCWLLKNIRPIVPIPWKGGQGFFNVPDEIFTGRYRDAGYGKI